MIFANMRPTAKALRGCEVQLKRIADSLEMWLAYQGLHVAVHKPDTSGEEPEVFYTNEQADWEREWKEREGMTARQEEQE